jgi:glycosyltransferase involved in cell wall biosynthesis
MEEHGKPFCKAMRVALVSEEYPPFLFGGIASVCSDLAQSLSDKGVHVTVLCGKACEITVERLSNTLEIIRMPCLDLPPRFVWFQIQNAEALGRILSKCDVIHVVDPLAGAVPAFLNRRLGKPLVTSVHGIPVSEMRVFFNCPIRFWSIGDLAVNVLGYAVTQPLFNTCLSSSSHIVFCSQTLMRETPAALRESHPFSVIPNAVNLERLSNVREHSDDSSIRTDLRLVYYGRLYWRKGLVQLIHAVARLEHDFPSMVLDIFGKGPLEGQIRRMISRMKLGQRIRIRGHVPYEELVKSVSRSDVVVLPSLYEAQSIAVLEAMALKKAVVAFNFPFSREIIYDQHTGLLAKPGDVTDLSQKISQLLRDGRLRRDLGRNALHYVREKHDWNKIVERYVALYEEQIASI